MDTLRFFVVSSSVTGIAAAVTGEDSLRFDHYGLFTGDRRKLTI